MLKFYSSPRKKAARPEAKLQKVICSYLLMNDAFFFSIPNERVCSVAMMAELKAMGLRKGAADLCIIIEGRAHFLELKSNRGKQSVEQKFFESDCVTNKASYDCVNSLTDALKTLSLWGAIKPARVAA